MDIIYVTYNSEMWIDACFNALLKSNYNIKQINIFVLDNNSTDKTVEKLYQNSELCQNKFGKFEIVQSEINLGFGRANNLAFGKGNSDIAVFLNIDTEVYENTLNILEREIKSGPYNAAMWEMRQIPYEHPKIYNPVTMETSWCSGAAFAVKREVFQKLGGFDEKFFMYVEDVDLSWRFRANNYKIIYCPKAVIKHYSYKTSGETKPTQYIFTTINNLIMRYRYGSFRNILGWYRTFFHILRSPSEFVGVKQQLIKRWLHVLRLKGYLKKTKIIKKEFTPQFIGFDYERVRSGGFYENKFPNFSPLISVIVRTCGRPCVLREALISIRNQTYSNIEIVIVEDGKPQSKQMIEEEFGDLNIKYFATEIRVGRSKAGNLAMKIAAGEYFNFLDDDDLFYADHIEVLVSKLEKTDCLAVYSIGCETKILVNSYSPYIYNLFDYNEVHKQKFDKLMLCHHNYIPIQCIMFHKSLFNSHGGFDETLDSLEDWDLWVRYSLYTNFEFVEKTTSLYRVPYNDVQNRERQKNLDEALKIVREKHKLYNQTLSVNELAKIYEKIISNN